MTADPVQQFPSEINVCPECRFCQCADCAGHSLFCSRRPQVTDPRDEHDSPIDEYEVER